MTQWPETQEFPMLCVPLFSSSCANVFICSRTYLLGEPDALGVLAKTFPPTPGNAPRLLDRAFPSAARLIAENWKLRRTWRSGKRNTHDTQSSRTRDGAKVQWWWEQVQLGAKQCAGPVCSTECTEVRDRESQEGHIRSGMIVIAVSAGSRGPVSWQQVEQSLVFWGRSLASEACEAQKGRQ